MPDPSKNSPSQGRVYLVGAGPGDPKLVTIRGAELLARADVVVIDRLANPRLLAHAREAVEVIYAGKSPGEHSIPQDQITGLIIDRASRGLTVVRLKGGDPFVFGRGGEEAEALAQAGIEFEVVPGVSSAIAVPAYAGIPVTSRGRAASFGVVTGHEAPGKPETDIKWDRIATGLDTIVLLMGVENLSRIVEELVANGRGGDTPVAVIGWGTYPRQRTITGTLGDIAARCREAGLESPAVTVVGEVVRMRQSIAWFEKRPLAGKRVIVTRAEHQAGPLVDQLEELGAQVHAIPVIRMVPPADCDLLDSAIGHLDSFDWIVFTSANGVEWFVKRLLEKRGDIRAFGRAKIAAIGPKTAAAVAALKLKVDFTPTQYVAEAVVSQFPEKPHGKSVLIPRAADARDELPRGLKAAGASVSVVPVYVTVTDKSSSRKLEAVLREGIDVITFTSPSTVESFFCLAGREPIGPDVTVACIGPVTAEAARAHGLDPAVVAEEYTIEGLVKAMVRLL